MNQIAQPKHNDTITATSSKTQQKRTFKAEIEVETSNNDLEIIEEEIEAENLKEATSKARGMADMRTLEQLGKFSIKNVYKVEVEEK